MTGAALLPAAVAVDSVIDIIKSTNESLARGQASIDQFAADAAKYADSYGFEQYSNLYGYLHIKNAGEGSGQAFEGMDAFAQAWDDWWNDRTENPVFDRMLQMMDDDKFDRVQAAMEAYTSGVGFDRYEMNDDLQAGLDAMKEAIDDLSGEGVSEVKDAGKDMSDAAGEMAKLPKETAVAVAEALNGARVVIDGAELTAVVGNVMAGVLARYSV